MSIIFEKSVPDRRGVTLPRCDVPAASAIPEDCKRTVPLGLCELSELDVVRHFTELSRKNFGVDTGFYPLGSCTMKYNPKVLEQIAALSDFIDTHPFLPQFVGGAPFVQAHLHVLHGLDQLLCEITGMKAFTMQPLAGAHGELTGMMLVAAYHKAKGNKKTELRMIELFKAKGGLK